MAASTAQEKKPAPKSRTAHYSPAALSFLVELGLNNNREWFKANQERYEQLVREPTLALIRDVQPLIARLSPHLVASDKKVGGSMMRPQRDTRFAADKVPYKTNVGVQFRHSAGKDVHAPGLYFHFDPDSVFVAAGIWHPDAEVLRKVRKVISEKPKTYLKAISSADFKKTFELKGESLQRAPKGFAPDHPLIDELRRKDFIAVSEVSTQLLYSARLAPELARRYAAANDFMRMLCGCLEHKY